MRTRLVSVALVGVAACHSDPVHPPTADAIPPDVAAPDAVATSQEVVSNQHIVYSDRLHNENTTMLALRDRILLAFRGGATGQAGSESAHIDVFATSDQGKTFAKQAEVNAGSLPGMRDIRDPKLISYDGKLFLYAISRLPGGHYRDLAGEAWTVRAESSDGGVTWSNPVQTFSDLGDAGKETFWGFWRFTPRTYVDGGATKQTLYALGYDDGDVDVGLFASIDGVTWEKRAIVMSSYDDVPSEAELQFFGDNAEKAVAIVRLDNQGILQDGQSAICTSQEPFTTWECGRRIEQRLDGPTFFTQNVGGTIRNVVIARKHLPCTYKRTALYELRGDLTDPSAPITVCEVEELKSAGDTAYASVAPLESDEYLMSWYSSTIPSNGDIAWLEAQYAPSDIWLANLDLSRLPSDCHPSPAKKACDPPPLPVGDASNGSSGDYLWTVAPVIDPASRILFRASLTFHDASVDAVLQPLDPTSFMPVGTPWTTTGVTINDDGTFSATFNPGFFPVEAYPLLADPVLSLSELAFHGVCAAKGVLCGNLTGLAQVFGTSKSDQIDLRGSTFGAVAISGGALPTPVAACPATK
jgi:hypothetical protein